MSQFFAIAIYRCLVSGETTGSLDFQVRYFVADSEDEVRRRLGEEEAASYKNGDGDDVKWELRGIVAVEEVATLESGEEIVGFVAEHDELMGFA